jgi:hypothetical protein
MNLKVTITGYSGLVAPPTLAVPTQHGQGVTTSQDEKRPALRLVDRDA